MADSRPLVYGSLFSGIEGIGLAFERCGLVPAFQVEINPHPRSVLERHWPTVPKFTDVQEVHAHDHRTCPGIATAEPTGDHRRGSAGAHGAADPQPWRGRWPDGADRPASVCALCGGVERVDVLVGGFPCQDLSVAGGRAGLAGARSGLWWHFARLISELAPRWCIIENVPGLLSSNDGRDMGVVLGTLGDLGYGFAWRVLDAQWFGVPQRRERVVLVGCAGDWAGPAAVLLEPETGGGHPPQVHEKAARAALRVGRRPRTGRQHRGGVLLADDDLVSSLTSSLGSGGPDAAHAHAGWYVAEEVSGPVLSQGDGGRGFRLEPDGSNLVAEVSPPVMAKWAKGTGGPSGDEVQNMVVEAVPIAERGRDGVTALEMGEAGEPYNALRAGDGGSSRAPLVGVYRKEHHAADVDDAETWVEDDAVQTLTASDAHRPNEVIVQEVVPLNLRHAAHDIGNGAGTPSLGDGEPGDPSSTLMSNVPPAVAYKVTPEGGQGADLNVQQMGPDEPVQTLTAVALGRSSDRQPLIRQEFVVRRLMPVECLRLQGFPDDHCGEHTDEWTRPDGLSDSAAYSAAGNAVAVPVFHWTGLRLLRYHQAHDVDTLPMPEPRTFAMPELVDLDAAVEVETTEQGALW